MFFDPPETKDFDKTRRKTDGVGLSILAQTERYWRSQVASGLVPKRSDIDPSGVTAALPNMMIFERIAPGMARVRLAGQKLTEVFGMDVRGMPASILVSPDNREALGAQIEAVFAGPAIVEVPLTMARGWGRKPAQARLLLLPLRDHFGDITRAMAVLALDSSVPTGGRQRFEIDKSGAFRCTLMPIPTAMTKPRVTADRRAPVGLPDQPVVLPIRPKLPPFGVVDGGKPRRSLAVKDVLSNETRPPLQLVVSND